MKLEIGYNHDIEVRKEIYGAGTEKICILFISDLHFNRFSEKIAERLAILIENLNPTILLFGGDYIDERRGWKHLDSLFKSVSARPNVFAIAGNHDYFYGIEKIKFLIETNGSTWLENSCKLLQLGQCKIQLTANPNAILDKADLNILCIHKPIDESKIKHKFDMIFAGHLHGCQFVFWENEKGLYPGRFFYKHNFLKKSDSACHYYISKGIGDTLPVRYNCKRDVILVEVAAK